MAFNGRKEFPGKQIVEFLETIGMQFGPEVNAFTSFDETVYMLSIPADEPELLEKGLHVPGEWAFGMVFDPDELERAVDQAWKELREEEGGLWSTCEFLSCLSSGTTISFFDIIR